MTDRRRAARHGLLLAGTLGLAALGLARTVPLPARLTAPDSTVVRYHDGTTAHVTLAPDDRLRIPVRLFEVDPAYRAALLRLEDKRFARHLGVDPVAVLRAAGLNLRRGEVVSGASTITMQLVRLAEPRPRTLRSKAIEALRAVQLELLWSKRRILERYLELAPFGGNIEGVEAASLAWFGHRATALSPAEIAVLLAVPQNPTARRPGPDNRELRAARDAVARRLTELDALPRGADKPVDAGTMLSAILNTPVPRAPRPMPREAPHTADWLRAQDASSVLRTSLDRGLQGIVEEHLARAEAGFGRKGVHNAAVVVLEHGTGKLRALGGNFAYWDDRHGRRIPAFAVPRSPGSTLKPFLYAASIDRGVALPEFLVPDVPTDFGGYAPRNYDDRHDGLVRLDDALSRSLNVPFVRLLKELGTERFLADLRRGGVLSLVDEPGFYGLSVAVGGVELSPLEVAGLYAALAGDGRVVRPSWRAEDDAQPPESLMSAGAAWLTRQTLRRKDRPDFPARSSLAALPPHIHWKTGTSTGRRDAWAVGSGPRYTVAVWLGNLDYRPSAHLVGADAAGPLLFDLLEAIEAPGAHDDPRPDGLASVEVCAYSGHAPTAACPTVHRAWARPDAVPTTACPYHVKVAVDRQTGLALSADCRAGRDWTERTFLLRPSEVRRWLSAAHRVLPEAPRPAPGCRPPVGAAAAPRITSPPEGQAALLMPGLARDEQQIPLSAESDAGRLSWFVNGEYLGSAPPEQRLWWTPEPGQHRVVVTDERGRRAVRLLEVRERYSIGG